jgi:hypothetical protein
MITSLGNGTPQLSAAMSTKTSTMPPEVTQWVMKLLIAAHSGGRAPVCARRFL